MKIFCALLLLGLISADPTSCCGWAPQGGPNGACRGQCYVYRAQCNTNVSWDFGGQTYGVCECQDKYNKSTQYCCPPHFHTPRCDQCIDDLGCPADQQCNHSITWQTDKKALYCDVTDSMLMKSVHIDFPNSNGTIVATCNGQFLVDAVHNQNLSLPEVDYIDVHCKQTSCKASDDCNFFVKAIIAAMKTDMYVKCLPNGTCWFWQNELMEGYEISLQCTSSECVPKHPKFVRSPPAAPLFDINGTCDLELLITYPHVADKPVYEAPYFKCSINNCEAHINRKSSGVLPPLGPPDTNSWVTILYISSGSTLLLLLVGWLFLHRVQIRNKRAAFAAKHAEIDLKPLKLSCENISYFLSDRPDALPLVEAFTGSLCSGQSLAVLGPSGAGKTTLIDVLAGRDKRGKLLGELLVNDCAVTPQNKAVYRETICGYVMQDDCLPSHLTVFECVLYAAQLRLPADIPLVEKQQRVEQVLEELGLTNVRNTRIGNRQRRGVSGGELKRAAIAMELVANPKILLLDEPTSGLDSYHANSVMTHLLRPGLLKEKAGSPRPIIIFSIHQPSADIFALFDQVLLLCRGRTVYCGPGALAAPTLGLTDAVENPAEFLLEYAVTRAPATLAPTLTLREHRDTHVVHSVNGDILQALHQNHMYYPTTVEQLPILLRRCITIAMRTKALFITHSLLSLTIGIFISVLYHRMDSCSNSSSVDGCMPDLDGVWNRSGASFFIMAFLGLASLSAVDTFFEERTLFCRERASGYYSTAAYYFPKLLVDFLALRALPALLLCATCYFSIHGDFGMGLRAGFLHFAWFAYGICVFNMCAAGLAVSVACASPTFGVAALVCVLIMLFFMAFGGLLSHTSTIPPSVAWCGYLSFFRYAYELVLSNELRGRDILFNPVSLNPSDSFPSLVYPGDMFLKNMGLDASEATFAFDAAMLLVWLGVYTLLGLFFLRFIVSEKR